MNRIAEEAGVSIKACASTPLRRGKIGRSGRDGAEELGHDWERDVIHCGCRPVRYCRGITSAIHFPACSIAVLAAVRWEWNHGNMWIIRAQTLSVTSEPA